MNVEKVLDAVEKGLMLISGLAAAGSKIEPALKVVFDLTQAAKDGKVTDDQITAAEAQLDAMIDEFNAPLD